MFSIRDYASYCGPGAFAAVTGISRQSAASVLCRWSVRCGLPAELYTVPVVMAVALVAHGCELESWSPRRGGWRVEDRDEFRRWVWSDAKEPYGHIDQLEVMLKEYHAWRATLPPEVDEEIRASRKISRAREQRRHIDYLTVGEWLARFPLGLWVLHVTSHVMVARDGEIIAGEGPGQNYRDAELNTVWRVIRTESMRAREDKAA